MTTIDRTAYPRFRRVLSARELTETYTLSAEELAFVDSNAIGETMRLNLAVQLKCCQRLAYFPRLETIPPAIIQQIRQQLELDKSIVLAYDWPRTLYRHHELLREYLGLLPYTEGGKEIAEAAMEAASQTMLYTADLINAAIEELVHQKRLLPAFSSLNNLAISIRQRSQQAFFDAIYQALSPEDIQKLDEILSLRGDAIHSLFTSLKQVSGRPNRKNLQISRKKLASLEQLQPLLMKLKDFSAVKIDSYAAEAHALELGDMLDLRPEKRYSLLLCFLFEAQRRLRDELTTIFIKRLDKVRTQAKNSLEELKAQQREMRERFVDLFAQVLDMSRQTEDDARLGASVRSLLGKAGGAEQLWEDYEVMAVYHQDNYLPLMWRHYKSHRRALFDLLEQLEIHSTSQEQQLVEALNFIKAHRHIHRALVPFEIDISFLSQRWRQLVLVQKAGELYLNRRQLEVAVFAYVAAELKTGDLAVTDSEDYADYREQLLPWERCLEKLPAYCAAMGFASNAKGFVEALRQRLQTAIRHFDQSFPEMKDLVLNEDGTLSLKRLAKRVKPDGLDELEEALRKRLPERQLLDVLARVHHWLPFTQHFGHASGSEAKMSDATARYLLTVFAYASNLGPKQTAQHSRTAITARVLKRINLQHISLEQLDKAIREVINHYARFDLPRLWGTGKAAAADGTQFDMYRNNLMAERHIRYGGYGGIAYHHVSDTYVALFSHFINVGVWEAVYILDGLLKNTSDVQPDTLHADTHGQSEPVFGLAHLLGIQLMPRIRNWKKLILYRADASDQYLNVDALFTDVIDWPLLETHWQDLMQVVISILEGKVLPSMLLRKLRHDSHKNRLYRAFRELGRVIRTLFLIDYLSDPTLRRQILSVTNQVEAYNGFSGWLFFGDEGVIKHNDPIEQEKRIKYNTLLANVVMIHNLMDMTRVLQELRQEGYTVNKATLARLSPYLTEHLRRFGEYVLDLSQVPEPPLFELDLDQDLAS